MNQRIALANDRAERQQAQHILDAVLSSLFIGGDLTANSGHGQELSNRKVNCKVLVDEKRHLGQQKPHFLIFITPFS